MNILAPFVYLQQLLSEYALGKGRKSETFCRVVIYRLVSFKLSVFFVNSTSFVYRTVAHAFRNSFESYIIKKLLELLALSL